MEVPEDATKCRCRYCHCVLKAKLQDLKNHVKTKKYVSALSTRNITPVSSIFKCSKSSESAKIEGSLAMFLCCHCAIRNCDHLVDLLKNNVCNNKAIDEVKMHRTKCTNIIKNVLCPHFEEDLRCDVGSNKFSLLLDESNDISVIKMLGVTIIYFSDKTGRVVSTYLGLVHLEKCDAESIVIALKELLSLKKLNLKNLSAIGTDNASVMIGINNGVHAKLKEEVPSLILIRCTCHYLQLAVSHASAECLPRNLEFLIAESHNWFSHSSIRQQQYCNLYKAINDGQTPLKIPAKGQTRWLSIQVAVERIVNQWTELKLHFQVTR